jgi:hypothetical protein
VLPLAILRQYSAAAASAIPMRDNPRRIRSPVMETHGAAA